MLVIHVSYDNTHVDLYASSAEVRCIRRQGPGTRNEAGNWADLGARRSPWCSMCIQTHSSSVRLSLSRQGQMQVALRWTKTGFSSCIKMVPVKSHNGFCGNEQEPCIFCWVRTKFYHKASSFVIAELQKNLPKAAENCTLCSESTELVPICRCVNSVTHSRLLLQSSGEVEHGLTIHTCGAHIARTPNLL